MNSARSRSTTTEDNTGAGGFYPSGSVPPSAPTTPGGTPRRTRPPPLPAVKGTIGGIERVGGVAAAAFSPGASTVRASEPLSPAPSALASASGTQRESSTVPGGFGEPSPVAEMVEVDRIATPSGVVTETITSAVAFEPAPRAPKLVWRAETRMGTCFDGLPVGSGEVKGAFGL